MYCSHADVIKQLESWGFRSGKTKYGKVLMRGPSGGHVWAVPASVAGPADNGVVEQASRLLGVTVERFWRPIEDFDKPGSVSLSKRFASSYQAEILRYLDRLPGSVLEDSRLGVAHAVWSVLGERAGKNLSSCASAISALESDGRLASEYGHRSLDGRLCRVKVSVLAEPPAGSVSIPVDEIEVTGSGSGGGGAQTERIQEERENELIAHIEHLSEEAMLWEDMAAELEAKLNEALAMRGGDDEGVLDYFSKEIERQEIRLRWRTRQLERRDATISAQNATIAALQADLRVSKQHGAELQQRLDRLEKSLAAATAERNDLRETTSRQESEVKSFKAALLRLQERMFLIAFSAVSSYTQDRDVQNDTLEAALAPVTMFFKENGKRHRYHSVVSRADGLGQESLDFDIKGGSLPLQSVDEQPLDIARLKRDLSTQIGSWYMQLLHVCMMLEDAGAQVAVKQSPSGGWYIELDEPVHISDKGRGLVVHGRLLPLAAAANVLGSLDTIGSASSSRLLVSTVGGANKQDSSQIRRALSQNQTAVSGKDLIFVFNDPELSTMMVILSNKALSRSVPLRRVEEMLSAPGRHYGIRDAGEPDDAYNLGIGTALLGMAGIRSLANDADDPRQLIINNGEITDLYGRILYLSEDRSDEQSARWTVHSTGHRDWLVELRIIGPEEQLLMSAVFGAK
jgi:hypothetical protein